MTLFILKIPLISLLQTQASTCLAITKNQDAQMADESIRTSPEACALCSTERKLRGSILEGNVLPFTERENVTATPFLCAHWSFLLPPS